MTFPFGETVTVQRPTEYSDYGDPLAPAEFTLSGVAFAPRSSTELSNQRNTVIVGMTMYAPYGSDVRPIDTIIRTNPVTSETETYNVDGEVGPWLHPLTGWAAGTEVALRRVTG